MQRFVFHALFLKMRGHLVANLLLEGLIVGRGSIMVRDVLS